MAFLALLHRELDLFRNISLFRVDVAAFESGVRWHEYSEVQNAAKNSALVLNSFAIMQLLHRN